jgi:hypothetical protein
MARRSHALDRRALEGGIADYQRGLRMIAASEGHYKGMPLDQREEAARKLLALIADYKRQLAELEPSPQLF